MKSFGDYFKNFVGEYKQNNPEINIEEQVELILMNNWVNIAKKYSDEQGKLFLMKAEFISLISGELKISGLNSTEKFVFNTMDKKIISYLNSSISLLKKLNHIEDFIQRIILL